MKKVLLLGEYSGLHTNLKEGLVRLGYDVDIASNGDGKKNIEGDIDLRLTSSNKMGKFIELKKKISTLEGYDIVQFINPYISHRLGVLMYGGIYKNNGDIHCVAAGDDWEFLRFVVEGGMKKYSPFDYEIMNSIKLPYTSKVDEFLHILFMENVKSVIPAMWEYAESYRTSNYKKILNRTIPLSIDLEKNKFEEQQLGKKIVFYHASNRPVFKGSNIICEAMDIFQKKYPNDVEMIQADFLPLNEYLEVIKRTNVVIDQCRSYSYGMNAIYAGAKGKIVMSGSEDIALKELDIKESPIINITPSVDQIKDAFEKILDEKNKIIDKSYSTRNYIQQYHDNYNIARKYLEAWGI